MRNLLVCIFFVVACGGKKPEPAPAPQPEPAGSGSAAADDAACKAAGGTCMNVTAAIACTSKPEAACQPDHFCCIP